MIDPSHDKVFQALTDMGYNVYNTRWICNSIKGEHLTFEEMKEVVKLIINMRNLNE